MIAIPEERTPEWHALMKRVADVKGAVMGVHGSSSDEGWREFYLADLRQLGFERAVDAEGWLRRLRRSGLDV